MSVKVRIPSPLRTYTNGADVVEASGANVGEVLGAAVGDWPVGAPAEADGVGAAPVAAESESSWVPLVTTRTAAAAGSLRARFLQKVGR